MKKILLTALALSAFAIPVSAQTIDCDAAAPTTPGVVRTGQPYTVAFCVPSIVTTTDGDVPNRIDGFTMQVDATAPFEAGKLTLGTPAPTTKLSPVTYRTTAGVQKGSHTIIVTPWNYPLMPDGSTPDTTKPHQNGPSVSIPFVANDPVLSTAPPAIQKGRVSR